MARALAILALLVLAAGAAEANTAETAASGGRTLVRGVKAIASSKDISTNWSGYAVAGAGATAFTNVSGTWVEPTGKCTAGSITSSAFWVGLGGSLASSQSLEQAGTAVDCSSDGTARYSAWYELVPAPAVTLKLKVLPHDRISASVKVNGRSITIEIKDLTKKTSVTKTRAMSSPDTSSAEWIAEAPSLCNSDGRCGSVPLTDFGAVKFTNASATGGGHTGTIADPAWTANPIQLVTQAGPGSFGPFASPPASAAALPSALSGNGGAFSVTLQQSVPSADPGPPGGFGPVPPGVM